MARSFNIPQFYKSDIVSIVKGRRKVNDPRKVDLEPTIIDLGAVRFKLARHFGFCFGVENAIEIAYKAINENPNSRIFLLSEMIHNPHVNRDLINRGVKFLMSTKGQQLISFTELNSDDIVIVPAFGTTVELFQKLAEQGINMQTYNATCPFVERVWKRASELGKKGFTIVIHGKHDHEETRATFSHSCLNGPSVIIRDIAEAKELAEFVSARRPIELFNDRFGQLCSTDFDAALHLTRIGVVNQTTMLATETQEISEIMKAAILDRYGADALNLHFADTRDTLCYATKENQDAVRGLIESGGDIAVIVGGYNSSNTSHLVELCEEHYPSFYIKDSSEIISEHKIRHLNMSEHIVVETDSWLPTKRPLDILISAGASCPDIMVDQVITRLAEVIGIDEDDISRVVSAG